MESLKRVGVITKKDIDHALAFIDYLQESIDEPWFDDVLALTNQMRIDEQSQFLLASILIHKQYLDLANAKEEIKKC